MYYLYIKNIVASRMKELKNIITCQYCKNIYNKDNINVHLKYCDKYKFYINNNNNNNINNNNNNNNNIYNNHNKNTNKNTHRNEIVMYKSSHELVINENVYIHYFQKYTELFHNYLENKTVALVGPAESIYGTNKGHVIDKFDIVVRLNKSIPLPENLQADIGTKTDILYNSLNTGDYPGQNKFGTELLQKYGVKFLCCPYPFSNSIFKPDILNYIQQYRFSMPFRIFNEKKYYQLESLLQTRPYTGTCAIADLLSFPIKYLYITGLDFYMTKYYNEYRKIKKNNLKNIQNNTIHKNGPQIDYLRNLSLTDDRIILDKFLDSHLYQEYYEVISKFKKNNIDIFKFDDPMLEKFFSLKTFNISYTKYPKNNTHQYKNEHNLIITNNNKFTKNENEYIILCSNNTDEVNFLNRQTNIKKYIGNFYFHNKKIFTSIYINPIYLQFIKNTLKIIKITNCNIHLVILLCIINFSSEKHYFNFYEVSKLWKLNNNELKFILFLKKKNLLHFYN